MSNTLPLQQDDTHPEEYLLFPQLSEQLKTVIRLDGDIIVPNKYGVTYVLSEAVHAIRVLEDKRIQLEREHNNFYEQLEKVEDDYQQQLVVSSNVLEEKQREIDVAWDWYGEALMEQDRMKEVNSVLEEKYIQTRKQNENLLSQVEFLQRKLAQVNTKKTVRLIAKRNTKVLFPRKMFKK